MAITEGVRKYLKLILQSMKILVVYPFVVKQSGNCNSNQCFKTISKLTISFLEQHLKNENYFPKTIAEEMNRTIHKK